MPIRIAGRSMILRCAQGFSVRDLNLIGGAQLNQIEPKVITRIASQKPGTALSRIARERRP
jgi:hypothetical protein